VSFPGRLRIDLQQIGRYEIIEELGKGAMGLVYKAMDPNIGRTVALKTMRLDVHGLEHNELLGRFRNEARAAGTLNHPNIVTIYDAGEHEGIFYIAMEFIEGRSLHEILVDNRVVAVEQVLSIARQVCAGLDYAHQHGVIHRDVKPANIMLTANGMAKIMDFGIAKAGGSLTSTGQVLGTPNYMAPEQIKGKALDGRSDLFSLGVILYEMLTGEKPFVGQNVTTIIYKIVNENPIPPRELDVSIHPGLSAVVTKALSKDADERYQSGAALAHDLENYKSFGSELGSTQSFSTTMMPAGGDQTMLAMPTPVIAPAAAVPARAMQTQAGQAAMKSGAIASADTSQFAVPQPMPAAPAARPKKSSKAPLIIVAAVVVIAVLGWFGLRSRRQPQVATDDTAQQLAQAQKIIDDSLKVAQQAVSIGKPSAVQTDTAVAPSQGEVGELKITTEPPGATVQMDGEMVPGITPMTVPQVKPGEHVLIATAEGWDPATKNVDVATGKSAKITLKLKRGMATLNLGVTPVDAEVLIDGKSHGKGPQQLQVPMGEHTLVLRRDGYQELKETLTINSAQATNIARNLKPVGEKGEAANPLSKVGRFFGRLGAEKGNGTLVVTTRPSGAQVLLNGSSAPRTTPVKASIPAGKYKMTIKLEGYKTIEREVLVEKEKTTGIDEILVK
jgi:serine/threonine protein kinase